MTATVPRNADMAHTNMMLGDGHAYCVFVWNLPPDFTEDELKFDFESYGEMAEHLVAEELAHMDN